MKILEKALTGENDMTSEDWFKNILGMYSCVCHPITAKGIYDRWKI